MFTLPDGPDALTALPPIAGPGPNPSGFYADCNKNPPGTIPVADDFNELIINLRALLVKGGVAPVKGDATMLWRAIFGATVINTPVTINVNPSGTASPANPMGGDPFATIAQALQFLSTYRITPSGSVTIQVAAGTYVTPQMITLDHPNGTKISIVGAGPTATILDCSSMTAGSAIVLNTGYFALIQGVGLIGPGWSGTPPYQHGGISSAGILTLKNVTVQNFDADGLDVLSSGVIGGFGTITSNNNGRYGLRLNQNATWWAEPASSFFAQNNVAAGLNGEGCRAGFYNVTTTGGQFGLQFGSQSSIWCGAMNIGACSATAVTFNSQSLLVNSTGGANIWQFAAGQGVTANYMSLIVSSGAIPTASRPNCSPAVNTIGNTNSFILA